MHSAPVPHRRQDALVRLPGQRRQGGIAARGVPGVDPPNGHRGKVYHRVAAGTLGPGHPGCHRQRPGQSGRLPAGPVAAHAHRRSAGTAQPDPPVEEVLPPPPVRHQLRSVRVHRSRLRPSGGGEHRQGGRHRQAGLSVGRQGGGRARCGGAPGPGGRAYRLRPRRDAVLLQKPGSHRRGPQG